MDEAKIYKLVMEQDLVNLMHPDNKIRSDSESRINQLITQDAENTARTIMQSAISTQSKEVMQTALLVLHKTILSKDEHFRRLSSDLLLNMSTSLLEFPISKGDDLPESIYKRLAEITVEISVKKCEQSNHIQFLLPYWNSPFLKRRVFILYSLELLFEFSFSEEVLLKNLAPLSELLNSALADTEVNVQVAGASALTMLIGGISSDEILSNFNPLVEKLFDLIIKVIQQQDEDRGVKMLNTLDDLISSHPKYIEKYAETLLWMADEMIQSENLPDSVRITAMSLVSTFAKELPICAKKSSTFENKILLNLFKILMANSSDLLEDELNVQEKDIIAGNLSQKSVAGAALDTIGQICAHLGNKYTLKKYVPYIMEGLKSDSWKGQHSGLIVMGILAEGAKENFADDFNAIAQLVVPFLTSSHPKVVYSCLTCIGFLAEEFAPELQKNFGPAILPSLIQLMGNNTHPQLSLRAVSCCINFFRELLIEDVDAEEGEPGINQFASFMPELIATVGSLFSKSIDQNSFSLLEEILSLISIISSLMKEHFVTHYEAFMDGVKRLLTALSVDNLTYEQKNLKALLIDTCGFLISSIAASEEIVGRDLPGILTFLDTQLLSATDDSPVTKSCINFYASIIKALKQKSESLFEKIFEIAFKFAQVSVEVHFSEDTDAKKINNKENYQSMEVDLKIFGGKKVLTINHVALELKISSFACLNVIIKQFAHKLSEERIGILHEMLLAHLSTVQSSAIKKLSCKIFAKIMASMPLKTAIHRFEAFSPVLLKYLGKFLNSEDTENLVYFLRKYLVCVKVLTKDCPRGMDARVPITPDIFDGLSDICAKSLTMSIKGKARLLKEYKNYDLSDPEVAEDFDAEMEDITSIDQIVMELSGETLKFDGPAGNSLTSTCLNFFGEVASKSSMPTTSKTEILYTLCFFADLLEFGSAQIFEAHYAQSLTWTSQIMLRFPTSVDILQTCSYLMGITSYKLPPGASTAITQSCMTALYAVLNTKEVIDAETPACRENAVSALFKLFLKHWQSLVSDESQATEVLRVLCSRMPLGEDLEESLTINRILLIEWSQTNAFLVGTEDRKALTFDLLNKIKQLSILPNKEKILNAQLSEFLTRIVG
jgi:hypothetical protein